MAMNLSAFSFMFLCLCNLFSATSVSSSTSPSYSHHCALMVPESTLTAPSTTIFPHPRPVFSHHTGGNKILYNLSSGLPIQFTFRPTKKIFTTNTTGVYNMEAYLIFELPEGYFIHENHHSRQKSLRFVLNGFWSEDSRKVCMVGSASWFLNEGNLINLDAVLKFNYAMNLTVFGSLISGKLESLASPNDLNYFEPISLLELGTSSNYQYPLVSGEFDRDCHGGVDIPKNQSLGFDPSYSCFKMRQNPQRYQRLSLEYSNECRSLKNCNPLGKDVNDELPSEMTLHATRCSGDKQKGQYVITFGSGFQPFDLSRTLVGEGSWDEKKNQLCIIACRLLNSTGFLEDVGVGDCSIRLSLRYPAFWSIRTRTNFVGQIWTNKTSNDFGYFHSIVFRSRYNSIRDLPGLRYEYTVTDKVRKLCQFKKPVVKKRDRYPTSDSETSLYFFPETRDSEGLSVVPNFVGDQIYMPNHRFRHSRSISTHPGPLNVSYEVSPYQHNYSAVSGKIPLSMFHMFAEGLYDEETGSLCLIGCRKISTGESLDCEILLKFQFPPVNAKEGGQIRGSIESIREETDPLYFKQWEMTARPFYREEAERTVRRLDLEIVMVSISNTLACVFIGLQILYAKRNPQALPCVSLVMLLILLLGHMIPLVLELEALFSKNEYQDEILLWSGGWVEANDFVVRAFALVTFLLQFRLLQLAFSACLRSEISKGLWVAEGKALFVSTTLHTLGLLTLLFLTTRKRYHATIVSSTSYKRMHFAWGDLITYGSFMLDWFLLPQILFNFFQVSDKNALSPWFYIGTTFVRLLPRVYDLSLNRRYLRLQLFGAYVLGHRYSPTWDVVIASGGAMFAAVIYLQQRYGGRCIIPRRFREVEVYEKVPVVSSDDQYIASGR